MSIVGTPIELYNSVQITEVKNIKLKRHDILYMTSMSCLFFFQIILNFLCIIRFSKVSPAKWRDHVPVPAPFYSIELRSESVVRNLVMY